MSNSRIAHGSGGSDIDVPDIDAPSSARSSVDTPRSRASSGATSHGAAPPRVGRKTPPPKPPRPGRAPVAIAAGGSPTPLVGTSAPTGVVGGPPSPRPPGSAWVMAQPVGGGAARITYARTASSIGVQASHDRPTIDPGAASPGASPPSGGSDAFSSRNSTGGSGRSGADSTNNAASSSGLGGVNDRGGSGRGDGDADETGSSGLGSSGFGSGSRVGSGAPGSNTSGLDAGPSGPGLAGPANGGTHTGPHSFDPGATHGDARGRADTSGPGHNNAGGAANPGNPTGHNSSGGPGAGAPGSAHTNGTSSADGGPPHLPGSHASSGDASPHSTHPSGSTDPNGAGHGDADPNRTDGAGAASAPPVVIPPPGDLSRGLLKSPNAPLGRYRKVEPLSAQMRIGGRGEYVDTTKVELDKIRERRALKGLNVDEVSCRMDLLDHRIAQAYAVRKARDLNAAGITDPRAEGYRGDVVSVFTAPEWTFKIPDTPLTPKQRDSIIKHYQTLSKRYPGMLIVPGSIVSNRGKKSHPQIEAEAIVVHDGVLVHRTRKKVEGQDLDGYLSEAQRQDRDKREKYFVGTNHAPNDTTMFEFEGLKCSLEICADHGSKRARNDANAAGHGVDVQILVSDGASINQRGLAVHKGGLVISNDAKFSPDTGETSIREVGRPGEYIRSDELGSAYTKAKNEAAATDRPTPEKPFIKGLQNREDDGDLQAPAPFTIERDGE